MTPKYFFLEPLLGVEGGCTSTGLHMFVVAFVTKRLEACDD